MEPRSGLQYCFCWCSNALWQCTPHIAFKEAWVTCEASWEVHSGIILAKQTTKRLRVTKGVC